MRYLTGSKRGEEMVEAAIVLPILILIILSLIMLIMYYFSCLENQIKVHDSLLAETQAGDAFFRRREESYSTSSKMRGLISILMRKDGTASIYEMHPGDILRAGQLAGLENTEGFAGERQAGSE